MSWDLLDELHNSELLRICHDCHCIVVRYAFDEHLENCLAYQKRWQEEYDSQLGASEFSPNWAENTPLKIKEAIEFLKDFKVKK